MRFPKNIDYENYFRFFTSLGSAQLAFDSISFFFLVLKELSRIKTELSIWITDLSSNLKLKDVKLN